jgi:hypothetical protein
MMNKLIKEITLHSCALPESIQQEVLDFIKFKESRLEMEGKACAEVSLLSEASLSEWNNDEEDEAWKSFQ